MAQSIVVGLELPRNWKKLRLPAALQDLLQELLDKQDQTGKLPAKERREATALTELVDMLSLMKLHAKVPLT